MAQPLESHRFVGSPPRHLLVGQGKRSTLSSLYAHPYALLDGEVPLTNPETAAYLATYKGRRPSTEDGSSVQEKEEVDGRVPLRKSTPPEEPADDFLEDDVILVPPEILQKAEWMDEHRRRLVARRGSPDLLRPTDKENDTAFFNRSTKPTPMDVRATKPNESSLKETLLRRTMRLPSPMLSAIPEKTSPSLPSTKSSASRAVGTNSGQVATPLSKCENENVVPNEQQRSELLSPIAKKLPLAQDVPVVKKPEAEPAREKKDGAPTNKPPSRTSNLAKFPEPPMVVVNTTSVKKHTYRRIKYLGGGAFGRCYQVSSDGDEQHYALKAVPKLSLTTDYAKQKLFSEIQIQRHVRNDNIVRLYENFEDAQNIYLVLELCENQTLLDYIKNRGRLTEPEVRYYIYKIFQGLYHLHQRNIMHRDLKLCNLLLAADMNLKLGDFGLATLALEQERKKSFCGTPHYLAPEILQHGGYSFEVDVWATGVIMYTLLIGRTPFTFSKDQSEMYRKIRKNEYDIPSHIQLSHHARDLIKCLLCADPESRPTILKASRHPFFTAGIMPRSIPQWCLTHAPEWQPNGAATQSSHLTPYLAKAERAKAERAKAEVPAAPPPAKEPLLPQHKPAVQSAPERRPLGELAAAPKANTSHVAPTKKPAKKGDGRRAFDVRPHYKIVVTPDVKPLPSPPSSASRPTERPLRRPQGKAPLTTTADLIALLSKEQMKLSSPAMGASSPPKKEGTPKVTPQKHRATRHEELMAMLGAGAPMSPFTSSPSPIKSSAARPPPFMSPVAPALPSPSLTTLQKKDPPLLMEEENRHVLFPQTPPLIGVNRLRRPPRAEQSPLIRSSAIALPQDIDGEEERSRHDEVMEKLIKEVSAPTTPVKATRETSMTPVKGAVTAPSVVTPVKATTQKEEHRSPYQQHLQQQKSSTPKKAVTPVSYTAKSGPAPKMKEEKNAETKGSSVVLDGLYTRHINLPPVLDDATSPKTLGLVEQVYKVIHRHFTAFKTRSGGHRPPLDLDTLLSSSHTLAATPDMTAGRHALGRPLCANATSFVSKWIDYSQKYGLGYQLTDGCTGVFFNDSSTMLVAPNQRHVEYLDYIKKHGRMMMQRQNFAMDAVPSRVEKKWKLFHHFKGYMQDKLYQAPAFKVEDTSRQHALDFVVRHHRCEHGVIFRLSNGVIQINFYDHHKYIFTDNGQHVIVITEDRVPRAYNVEALFHHDLEQLMMLSPILKRLKFALLVMGSMIAKRVAQDHGAPYPKLPNPALKPLPDHQV